MRPKNRVFCYECKRLKLLFKTERKAQDFIRWNWEDIQEQSGRVPTRVYYCECCGGWHTTSSVKKDVQSKTQVVIDKFNECKNMKKAYKRRAVSDSQSFE